MTKNIHIEYSCFDIDDNLLHMPTKINMIDLNSNKHVAVSSEEFAKIRSDKENWKLADDAFVEFKDNGPRGKNAFIEDLIHAIDNKEFAPSWDRFINTISNGYLFALITARGHYPETFRNAVEWILDNYLSNEQKYKLYDNLLMYVYHFSHIAYSDNHNRIPNMKEFSKNKLVQNYLNECGFYGVSNDDFMNEHKSSGAESPEIGKEIALKEFIEKVQDYSKRIGCTISIGMSDDDIKNVTHVEKVFNDLIEIYPDTIFRLYDTSNRGFNKKVIKSFESFVNENYLDNSIVPHAKHSNILNRFYSGKDKRNSENDFLNDVKKSVFGENSIIDIKMKELSELIKSSGAESLLYEWENANNQQLIINIIDGESSIKFDADIDELKLVKLLNNDIMYDIKVSNIDELLDIIEKDIHKLLKVSEKKNYGR